VTGSKFAQDVLKLSGGTALAQVISVAALPVLSRIYTPKDFGVFTLYASIVSLLSLFTTFNLELTIMLARNRRSASQIVWLIFGISLVAAVLALAVVLLFRHRVAGWLEAPAMTPWLLTVPLSLFLLAGYQTLRYWAMRLRKFGMISRTMMARAATFACVAILAGQSPLIAFGGGGLILAFILAEVARSFIVLWSVSHDVEAALGRPCRRRIRAVARRYGPMAATMSVSTGLGLVYDRLPYLMISSFFGAATLGLYGVVERIIAAPSQLVSRALADVYRQRASALHRKEGKFDGLTARTIAATAAISIVPYAIGIFYAPTLFGWVLGESWRLAGQYASILMVGEFVAFILTPIDNGTVIVGARRFLLSWSLARLLLTLSLLHPLMTGLLDILGFLWAVTAIRIVMVIIDGWASYVCARTGRPIWEPARLKAT
jgi:O-antigen/teichoic acid export membrane protein